MELTLKQTNNSKGIAILMMLCLHLFNTLDYKNLFVPVLYINSKPLIYYLSLFCDCCVPIYCFCSGYGLYINFVNNKDNFRTKNYIRIFKLYINYWIILLLIPVGLGLIMGNNINYPGSFIKFLLNFFAINTSYCGAWWFITIYIILVLSSSFIFKIIEKYDYKIILIISFFVYILCNNQRVKTFFYFDNIFLDWLFMQIALIGNSQFMFVVGAISFKNKWYSKFSNQISEIKFKNLFFVAIITLSIFIHGIIHSFFKSVFTGLIFIFCINYINLSSNFEKLIIYFGKHSTNIWLVHMLFYAYFFKEIIFGPKYPILIYMWLLSWCLIVPHFINFVYNPIINWLNTKIK